MFIFRKVTVWFAPYPANLFYSFKVTEMPFSAPPHPALLSGTESWNRSWKVEAGHLSPATRPGRRLLYLLDLTRFNFWEEKIILTRICLYVKLSYYTSHFLLAKHPFDHHPLEINPNLKMEKKIAKNMWHDRGHGAEGSQGVGLVYWDTEWV